MSKPPTAAAKAKACKCSHGERGLLDRLYAEHPDLKSDIESHFDGWYVNWQEIIDCCKHDPACGNGYAESPTEMIHAIINDRDEWKARANVPADRLVTARMLAVAQSDRLLVILEKTKSDEIPAVIANWTQSVADAAAKLHAAVQLAGGAA